MHRTRIVTGLVVAALVGLGVVAPAAEAGPPTITSLTTTPSSLSASGGSLTVNAAVSGASTCTFATTPDLGSSIVAVSCTSGSFSRTVTIPANTRTTTTKRYTFSVRADNASGSHTRTLTLTQLERTSPGPTITSLKSTPSSLTSAGGTVTIAATITNGQTCRFTNDAELGGGTTTSSTAFIAPPAPALSPAHVSNAPSRSRKST